jgi:hypothetical protein
VWEKCRSRLLKCQLNSAAWVLPGEFNAMKSCARCIGGLTTHSGEVFVLFIALLSHLTASKAPFVKEESAKAPESLLDSAAWVLPGEFNAMDTVLVATGDLPRCRERSSCDLSHSAYTLTASKAQFVYEKSVKSPEMPPRFSGVGASR